MNTPGTSGTSISRTILNTPPSTHYTHNLPLSDKDKEMPVPPVPAVPNRKAKRRIKPALIADCWSNLWPLIEADLI